MSDSKGYQLVNPQTGAVDPVGCLKLALQAIHKAAFPGDEQKVSYPDTAMLSIAGILAEVGLNNVPVIMAALRDHGLITKLERKKVGDGKPHSAMYEWELVDPHIFDFVVSVRSVQNRLANYGELQALQYQLRKQRKVAAASGNDEATDLAMVSVDDIAELAAGLELKDERIQALETRVVELELELAAAKASPAATAADLLARAKARLGAKP